MNFENATLRLYLIFLIIMGFGCSKQVELQWNQENGYRWAELSPGSAGGEGFKKLTPSETGITFSNNVKDETIADNRNFANGAGVAIGDIDGDGLSDIYFASTEGSNRLYKNLGNFEFKDITEQAGVAHEGYNSTGVVFADLNGDGSKDLLITSLSDGNSIYLNDGTGVFTFKSDSGLGESTGSHSITLADIDGDDRPDLYIANYRLISVRDLYGPDELSLENTTTTRNGRMQISPEFQEFYKVIEIDGQQFRQETGAVDELYLSRGNGSFEKADLKKHFPVNVEGDAGLFKDWGFTPHFADLTGNGLADLYVTNDFWTPDRLWINQGDGIFHASDEHSIINQSFSSMGVDVSDLDKNGEPDIVVTEMLSGDHARRIRQFSDYMGDYQGSTHHNHNSVYLNRGDTTFAQIAHLTGLEASGWSWATTFLDADLNGHEDLIVATGFYRDYLDMDAQREINQRYSQMGEAMIEQGTGFLSFPELKLANKVFANNGDLSFTDMSSSWGFTTEDISMGMATGDLNNDGAPDLVFNRFNETAVVYENRSENPRISIRLKGKKPNTDAIGARVTLTGGPVIQRKQVTSGGIYLSGSDYPLVFAADESNTNHVIEICWPDETISRIENASANRMYVVDQSQIAAEAFKAAKTAPAAPPMFRDISDVIDHTHHESSYNDFQRVQPLLPKQLSRKGPTAAWIDYNENGRDDLFITEGKGGQLQLFENKGNLQFTPADVFTSLPPAPGDQVSLAGWSAENGVTVAVGSSNYEQGNPTVASALLYSFNNDQLVKTDSISGILSSTGPVVAADYDGSGSVDLFAGGHFLPGGYPKDASSRLFKNENGSFRLDEQNSALLNNAGLVNAALFADFTQTGSPDLLISTEWGELKLFENSNGRLHDISAATGLDRYSGWWNGIASGDFNNDGLTDFVALNIGTNSPYKPSENGSLRLYYDDLNLNNRLDIVDSYYYEPAAGYVPRHKLLDFRSIPTILRNVRSHEEFSKATNDEIFNQDFSRIPFKQINTVHHLVFLNTGSGFETQRLPVEAQISTGYHAGTADFDNDGNEDLFISQNSFEYPPSVAKQDAGRGLILMGEGNGSFTPLSGTESGIKIYGEQRGAAFSDFNADGKTDLVVTQNGGQTKLFVNQTNKTGIRIRLSGPIKNKTAIGSAMRLIYKDGSMGPLRIIQAGSGYRSQNGTTQVLGFSKTPKFIEVTWFDGTSSLVDYVDGKLAYVIFHPASAEK